MIVVPQKEHELWACIEFMNHHAHVLPAPDTKYIGWVEEDTLKMLVAFNAFLGKTCQIHVAMRPGFHYTPRKMLEMVFGFAFAPDGANVEMLLGVVNSKNLAALRYDLGLGFKELYRLPGLHNDGGDIVLLGMRREECRYYKKVEEVRAVREVALH